MRRERWKRSQERGILPHAEASLHNKGKWRGREWHAARGEVCKNYSAYVGERRVQVAGRRKWVSGGI